ncbi:MAG: hypothetical protein ACM3MI_08715, partial [Clostridiales bacterium]
MTEKKFINKGYASKLIDCLGEEFVVINNPDYVYPQFEICPMAEKIYSVSGIIPAFVMDMDGTTTTTEVLCIHSLEYMLRRISGKISINEWIGLDKVSDYPHIIGNSTTKHVEYLIGKYQTMIVQEELIKSFIHSSLWTLVLGHDEKRKDEVRNNILNLGFGDILNDSKFTELSNANDKKEISLSIVNDLYNKYKSRFKEYSFDGLVRIGIDVYYQRYHEILERIKNGEGNKVSEELFTNSDKHLIEPMPGVLAFLSLVKGWINEAEADLFVPKILEDYIEKTGSEYLPKENKIQVIENLKNLARLYKNRPAKTALVTSSIFYEADIVMKELMKMIRMQIEKIGLPEEKRTFLKNKFSDYNNVYDAFVTASDSSEIRLKPHRDLYSIALYKLHIA